MVEREREGTPRPPLSNVGPPQRIYDGFEVIAVSHRKSAARLFPKRLEIVRGGKVSWAER